MKLLVSYVTKTDGKPKLLGVYSEGFSMERKNDFKSQSRAVPLEDVVLFFKECPLTFNRFFEVDAAVELDEETFTGKFGEKLRNSVDLYGDEKTLTALSTGVN